MTHRPIYILALLTIFTLQITTACAGTFTVAGIRMTKNVKPLRELKRQHVVSQSLDFSCGAAGLSTLLHYYLGDPVSEQEIIEDLLMSVPLEKVIQRRGFSLYDLKTFAQQRGYKVTGYQMNINFLKNLKAPVLVPIRFRNYSHFVVVRGIVSDRVFLADPAAGNVSMKVDKFERIWMGGIGFVVEDSDRDPSDPNALEIREEDFVVMDYRHLNKFMNQTIMRTAVFPSEFK